MATFTKGMDMFQKLFRIAVIVSAFGAASLANAGEKTSPYRKVAPIYSLPESSATVEYDITYRDRTSKEYAGKMWMSALPHHATQEGDAQRWIETKIKGDQFEPRLGKWLISEAEYGRTRSFEASLLEAYHQEGQGGLVQRMNGSQISQYFTMGVSGELEFVKDTTLTTPMGQLKVKEMAANGRGRQRLASEIRKDSEKDLVVQAVSAPASSPYEMEYRVWISDEVPFGVARFEVWGQSQRFGRTLLFSATARVVR